jgi:hypothetical protein
MVEFGKRGKATAGGSGKVTLKVPEYTPELQQQRMMLFSKRGKFSYSTIKDSGAKVVKEMNELIKAVKSNQQFPIQLALVALNQELWRQGFPKSLNRDGREDIHIPAVGITPASSHALIDDIQTGIHDGTIIGTAFNK